MILNEGEQRWSKGKSLLSDLKNAVDRVNHTESKNKPFIFLNLFPEFPYRSFMFKAIWGLRNMLSYRAPGPEQYMEVYMES